MSRVRRPTPDLRKNGSPLAAPYKRLMAAVLQTVVDDCRGSVYRRSTGHPVPRGGRITRHAMAYVASSDRAWPFSFENLCDALSLDAARLRRQFQEERAATADEPPALVAPSAYGRRAEDRPPSPGVASDLARQVSAIHGRRLA